MPRKRKPIKRRRARVTDLSRSMWRDPVPKDGERVTPDCPQIAFASGDDPFLRV